ncbi:hypothetical protein NAC44_20715 [Allorhizobium sp. BGMRC 0089]|nr:hypothetical protein [Allorhizobium sonneratiae]
MGWQGAGFALLQRIISPHDLTERGENSSTPGIGANVGLIAFGCLVIRSGQQTGIQPHFEDMIAARMTHIMRPLLDVVHPRNRVGPHFLHEWHMTDCVAVAGNGIERAVQGSSDKNNKGWFHAYR